MRTFEEERLRIKPFKFTDTDAIVMLIFAFSCILATIYLLLLRWWIGS